MNTTPPRVRASLPYVLKTALLGGVAGAIFSFLAARVIGVSALIAATAGGVTMATIIGLVIYRDGRPNEEP